MCVETTETLFSSCLDRLFQHVRTGQFERFGPRTLSDRLGVSTLRFIFDGELIKPSFTPAMLEMEDEDEIDVMRHCSGA